MSGERGGGVDEVVEVNELDGVGEVDEVDGVAEVDEVAHAT